MAGTVSNDGCRNISVAEMKKTRTMVKVTMILHAHPELESLLHRSFGRERICVTTGDLSCTKG